MLEGKRGKSQPCRGDVTVQMPEILTDTLSIRGGSRQDVRGYEHSVSVLLPWRRYIKDARPTPVYGSPSRFELSEETRHGTLLSVIRLSSDPIPSPQEIGEMTGELAEAWVAMTLQLA